MLCLKNSEQRCASEGLGKVMADDSVMECETSACGCGCEQRCETGEVIMGREEQKKRKEGEQHDEEERSGDERLEKRKKKGGEQKQEEKRDDAETKEAQEDGGQWLLAHQRLAAVNEEGFFHTLKLWVPSPHLIVKQLNAADVISEKTGV